MIKKSITGAFAISLFAASAAMTSPALAASATSADQATLVFEPTYNSQGQLVSIETHYITVCGSGGCTT